MTSLTNLLDLLATPSNLLGAVSCFLLLEVLRLQTLAPKCRSKLQDLLDRTTLTTKITALLVLAWSLLLSLEIVKWQSPSQIAAVCLLGCLLSLSLQLIPITSPSAVFTLVSPLLMSTQTVTIMMTMAMLMKHIPTMNNTIPAVSLSSSGASGTLAPASS